MEKPGKMSSCFQWVKDHLLFVLTAIAVVVGLALGISLSASGVVLSQEALAWVSIWGELFLRMLDMVVLPLVASLIVVGINKLDTSSGAKLGIVSFVFVILNLVLAVSIGIIFMVAIKPASQLGQEQNQGDEYSSYTDIFLDLLRNLCPDNIVAACIQADKTEYAINTTINRTKPISDSDVTRTVATIEGTNLLGVVTVSVFVGMGMRACGDVTKPLCDVFEGVGAITIWIIWLVIWYSPLGVLSLLLGSLLDPKYPVTDLLSTVGFFTLTVLLAQLIFLLLVLPLISVVVTRTNPFKLAARFSGAYLAAVAPSSSAAGIPFVFQACEDMGIPSPLYKFTVPFYNTVCKGGSGMYVAMATIFLAQVTNTQLGAAEYVVLGILTLVMTVSVASVPSASIIVLTTVATSLGIPVQANIGLLFSVEWLLNRARVLNNVGCMSYGAVIANKLCGSESSLQLSPMKTETKQQNYNSIDGQVPSTPQTAGADRVSENTPLFRK